MSWSRVIIILAITFIIIIVICASLYKVGHFDGYKDAKRIYDIHQCKIIEEYRKNKYIYNDKYCFYYLKLEEMNTNKE
jgi:uncharacterized protein YvpB